MKKYILAIVSAFAISLCSYAYDLNQEAVKAYNDSDYSKAQELFEELIRKDGSSAEAYFNLGNAAVKNSDLGVAVVSYMRASRLAPSNNRIKDNLDFALSKVADTNRMLLKGKQLSVAPDSPSFFRSLYLLFAAKVSSNVWAYIAMSLFILALVSVTIYLFLANVLLRKIGFFGAGGLVIMMIIAIIFAFCAANHASSKNICVAKTYRVELMSEPSSQAKPVASTLSVGTPFEILESKKNPEGSIWYKVRFNHDFIGWLPYGDVEII